MSTSTTEAPKTLSPEQARQVLRDVLLLASPENAGRRAEIGWYITVEADDLYNVSWAIGHTALLASYISTEMEATDDPPELFNAGTVAALLELIHAGASRLSRAFEHVQEINHRKSKEGQA